MSEALTYPRIARFWLPLAGTWLMMALEGPFLAAVIARLAEPKPNLAAFGVAFAVAIIVESPVIMLMSASTALVRDRDSLVTLRRYTFGLNAFVTTAMLVLLAPPVYRLVSGSLLGLPGEVAELTYLALWIMLPWPGAIGDRRFHQGLLIRAGQTHRVAYGTVVRLGSMATAALTLKLATDWPGVAVGAAALSTGVVAEATMTRWMVRGTVAHLWTVAAEGTRPLTLRRIQRFYMPLALTSMLNMSVMPVVTFFMGQGRMALESLAVLPVINGLTFLFRSLGISYQEVGIALMGERAENYRRLRNFAYGMAAVGMSALAAITLTPLANVWFGSISGLSPELTAFARTPARIVTVLPALSVLLSLQRAVLVQGGRTDPITLASFTELLGIALVLGVLVVGLDWVGAVAAMLAIVVGRVVANLTLLAPVRGVLREVSVGR